MKKRKNINKDLNSDKKGLKLFEIIISIAILLTSLLGIIFALIAISKHEYIPKHDYNNALTALIIGVAASCLITYLAFETFFTENVYDVELTIRFFLLIIVIFGSIVSLGMGVVSFISIL